jgi:hypothetical protein
MQVAALCIFTIGELVARQIRWVKKLANLWLACISLCDDKLGLSKGEPIVPNKSEDGKNRRDSAVRWGKAYWHWLKEEYLPLMLGTDVSQTDLAAHLGIHQSDVSRGENHGTLSIDNLLESFRVFDLSWSALPPVHSRAQELETHYCNKITKVKQKIIPEAPSLTGHELRILLRLNAFGLFHQNFEPSQREQLFAAIAKDHGCNAEQLESIVNEWLPALSSFFSEAPKQSESLFTRSK